MPEMIKERNVSQTDTDTLTDITLVSKFYLVCIFNLSIMTHLNTLDHIKMIRLVTFLFLIHNRIIAFAKCITLKILITLSFKKLGYFISSK